MSMSWDNVCNKCKREFSSFAPEKLCNDCAIITKIKHLNENKIIEVTDSCGFSEKFTAKELSSVFGEMEVIENDPKFRLVLYPEELDILSIHLQRPIELKTIK